MSAGARRVLVTGALGFVGRSLVPALRQAGWEVIGTSRKAGAEEWVRCVDLTDRAALFRVVAESAPRAVVHLAGATHLPLVLQDPKGSFATNVLGTLNLLEAVASRRPQARILAISSCAVYGDPLPADLPLREESPLRAVHPYGLQKIGLELLAERFRTLEQLEVVVVRPFNHVGPGQDPSISLSHFAAQIAAAERGQREPVLGVGNLAARRDLLDVRDVVRAYLLLLEHPDPPPLVNVASGASVSIGEALEMLLRLTSLRLKIETDTARLRPLDVPELIGDAGRLHRLTGWKPTIPLAETLGRILTHARGQDYGGPW